MANVTPWTWAELMEMVKFKEGMTECLTNKELQESDKHEKELEKFIKQYEYAGALALEIARWCVRNNEPEANCYGPLCYLYPTSCSGCLFSVAGMCCSESGKKKTYKRLAIEYADEYKKVYGNVA